MNNPTKPGVYKCKWNHPRWGEDEYLNFFDGKEWHYGLAECFSNAAQECREESVLDDSEWTLISWEEV